MRASSCSDPYPPFNGKQVLVQAPSRTAVLPNIVLLARTRTKAPTVEVLGPRLCQTNSTPGSSLTKPSQRVVEWSLLRV